MRVQVDLFFRALSGLPAAAQLGLGGDVTPAYATLDARVAYQGLEPFELSLVGQNLLQPVHREFPGGTEIRRAVYAKVAARF